MKRWAEILIWPMLVYLISAAVTLLACEVIALLMGVGGVEPMTTEQILFIGLVGGAIEAIIFLVKKRSEWPAVSW